jgi:hypothetical protein
MYILLNRSPQAPRNLITHDIRPGNPKKLQLLLSTTIRRHYRISLDALLSRYFQFLQLHHLEDLLKTTTQTVQFLHSKGITFPLRLNRVSAVFPTTFDEAARGRDLSFIARDPLHVFLESGQVKRQTKSTPSLKRETQAIANFVAFSRILLRLRDAGGPIALEAVCQKRLIKFLDRRYATAEHGRLIVDRVANRSFKLTVALAGFFLHHVAHDQCRDLFEDWLPEAFSKASTMTDSAEAVDSYRQAWLQSRQSPSQLGHEGDTCIEQCSPSEQEQLSDRQCVLALVYYVLAVNPLPGPLWEHALKLTRTYMRPQDYDNYWYLGHFADLIDCMNWAGGSLLETLS